MKRVHNTYQEMDEKAPPQPEGETLAQPAHQEAAQPPIQVQDLAGMPTVSLCITKHIAGVEMERTELRASAETCTYALWLFQNLRAEYEAMMEGKKCQPPR